MMRFYAGWLAALMLMALISPAAGEVTKWEITAKEDVAGGKPMGERGPYQRWTGVVHFALDPKLEANKQIVDLDLAKQNADGKVEFWSEFEMFVPADLKKANGAIFYEVNNRGKGTYDRLIDGDGDNFLFRQGYIVICSGWIAEVLPAADRQMMFAPEAREGGKPIRGVVRHDFVIDEPAERAAISHRAGLGSYRPSERGLKNATLSMREREADKRQPVPREQWKLFISEVKLGDRVGQLPLIELEMKGGLKPGWIYELIYEAEGPVVQGVGLAGIRDLLSCLKFEKSERNPLVGPRGGPLADRVLTFGTSQSGRLLRHFLYEGFNADEQGRKVMDGVISHVAGAGLGSFNHRFASPTRTNGQHDEHLFPADWFPFTYGDSKDPYTGRTDGILRRAIATNTLPKLMHTQSSSEYWHRSGSLVHTDPLGERDAEIPKDVRIYTFGGTQHGSGNGFPAPKAKGQLPASPADYRPLMRALVTAMDEWVRDDKAPPPSAYPRIADGSLVGWKKNESGWPAVPGVAYPAVIHQPPLVDRGPEWESRGIATIEPPIVKEHYVVKVPAYGPDGNERGTLLGAGVAVPVATYTSWNLRNEEVGAAGELLNLQGGYIPFAQTEATRAKTRDPRPALLKRYPTYEDYEKQAISAAEKLIAQRYLLAEDLPRQKALFEKFRPLWETK